MNDTTRQAVIDVGTNSVKLLVAEVGGTVVRPLAEISEQTRLGHGFYESRRLLPAAMDHTAQVVAEFCGMAAQWGASPPRVIATSAAREAVNQSDLIEAIRQASGLTVQVISGDQEAAWAFGGVANEARFAGRPLLIVDVGGGSTQCIVGQDRNRRFCRSFSFGAVRLLEWLRPADPPSPGDEERCQSAIRNFLEESVQPVLAPHLEALPAGAVQLVGVSGTSSVLASMELGLLAYDRSAIESRPLTVAQVRARVSQLWSLPLGERRKVPGLPPNRADIILTGAAIYAGIMVAFGFTRLQVSTRGYRFGALLDGQKV
jgi:exopolyphosphatase / guanosine-5'-triphosphate,3'-diphosphate pyrophosphatase